MFRVVLKLYINNISSYANMFVLNKLLRTSAKSKHFVLAIGSLIYSQLKIDDKNNPA